MDPRWGVMSGRVEGGGGAAPGARAALRGSGLSPIALSLLEGGDVSQWGGGRVSRWMGGKLRGIAEEHAGRLGVVGLMLDLRAGRARWEGRASRTRPYALPTTRSGSGPRGPRGAGRGRRARRRGTCCSCSPSSCGTARTRFSRAAAAARGRGGSATSSAWRAWRPGRARRARGPRRRRRGRRGPRRGRAARGPRRRRAARGPRRTRRPARRPTGTGASTRIARGEQTHLALLAALLGLGLGGGRRRHRDQGRRRDAQRGHRRRRAEVRGRVREDLAVRDGLGARGEDLGPLGVGGGLVGGAALLLLVGALELRDLAVRDARDVEDEEALAGLGHVVDGLRRRERRDDPGRPDRGDPSLPVGRGRRRLARLAVERERVLAELLPVLLDALRELLGLRGDLRRGRARGGRTSLRRSSSASHSSRRAIMRSKMAMTRFFRAFRSAFVRSFFGFFSPAASALRRAARSARRAARRVDSSCSSCSALRRSASASAIFLISTAWLAFQYARPARIDRRANPLLPARSTRGRRRGRTGRPRRAPG